MTKISSVVPNARAGRARDDHHVHLGCAAARRDVAGPAVAHQGNRMRYTEQLPNLKEEVEATAA